ncbi:YdcF family protein [Fictibacillus sp. b24]|uniref:YdcF family protein n=1 Tax=Fictibacillus sp. b24 TaxID=3055863 RepID=UPI00259FEA2E|nr:YdcF family protein [Fictibacillus sp. b24]MDM5317229.1 YdcF family protein [Fictibacillus sp. b24]
MLISSLDSTNLTREQITNLLFTNLSDDGECGDCILVFGGKSMYRIKKAADLFLANRAPFILVSGSSARWDKEITEAEWMKEHLVRMGVPEDKIILEQEATNTTENVIGSAYVLQRKFGLQNINRMLVVSSPYHMKRCSLTLKTYMPNWIQYTYCSDDRPYGQRDNWWKESTEESRVLNEVSSLIKYVRAGILEDVGFSFEI